MKLRELLGEAVLKKWSVKKHNADIAVTRLNKNYADGLKAITNGGVLFRGMHDVGVFAEINSLSGLRTSRDSNNLYQLLMDASPALASYPSRSKSFICSTMVDNAIGYNHRLYAVIPTNGVGVAVSSSWDLLNDENLGLDKFAFELVELLKYSTSKRKSPGVWKNLQTLDAVLQLVPAEAANAFALSKHPFAHHHNFEQALKEIAVEFVASPRARLKLLAGLMTPDRLRLSLVKFGLSLGDDEFECWVSGKCMLIHIDMFVNMLQTLNTQKFPIHEKYVEAFNLKRWD